MSLSRVKKNEELYKDINTGREEEITSPELQEFANRLNAIDEDSFTKMEAETASSEAQHAKAAVPATVQPEEKIEEVQSAAEEKKETVKEEKKYPDRNEPLPSFNNEYLDEFIDEVKQYNISKGLRTVEDTELNILSELRGTRTRSPEFFRQQKEKEDGSTIAFERSARKEVQPLEKKEEEVQRPFKEADPTLEEEIQAVLKDINVPEKEEVKEDEHIPSEEESSETKVNDFKEFKEESKTLKPELNEELLQKTTELTTKMESYDSKLEDVDEQVSTVNKVLNILLTVLLIILVCILGVLVYYILKSRGII